MSYAAKILADSISPDGVRLTTVEGTFPRIVIAEFNTHRMFSRNSASSRAIPTAKLIEAAKKNPYIPIWGKNQSGMQAFELLDAEAAAVETAEYLKERDAIVAATERRLARGVHKQDANRLLEPFLWHTVIVSATEWENFRALRCPPSMQFDPKFPAHPAIQLAAIEMMKALDASTPTPRAVGEWHLPLVDDSERAQFYNWSDRSALQKCCVGRCARVSYLTHDGRRDPIEDVALADRLRVAGHMSPFEHAATPLADKDEELQPMWGECDTFFGNRARPQNVFSGNFRGWKQYRKMLPNEAVHTPAV